MRPFVMVGVGGSGGKTLRVVREVLRQRLERAGWDEPWPRAWQLVHIDVPAEADGVTEDLPFTLTREQYEPLTTKDSTYPGFDFTVAEVKGEALARYRAYDSWRPDPPESVRVEIIHGAGQYRAVGRVALQARLGDVASRLQEALNDATSAPADVLARLERLFTGRDGELGAISPLVMVVGSVAGGSGSGMILDVCDVLRGLGEQHQLAVIFAPELFAGQDGATGGLAPNTFMAVNELSNAMWVTSAEDQPRSRSALFARAGIAVPVGRSGPSAVVLVGSKNSNGIALGTSSEIYGVMGRALGEMMLDARLMSAFESVALGNQQAQQLSNTNAYPVRLPAGSAVPYYRGMGFARLSIGRDLLLRYSVERLARACTRRLLNYHTIVREPGDDTTDAEMLRRVADQLEARFFDDARLSEAGAADNMVIDAIWPETTMALLAAWKTRTTAHVIATMKGKRAPAADVGGWVAGEVNRHLQVGRQTLRSEFEAALYASASSWVDSIQDHLQEAVKQAISDAGLPVAAELLLRLRSQLEVAAVELSGDSRRAANQVTAKLSLLQSPQSGRGDRVPADQEAVGAVVSIGREALKAHCQSQWLQLAATLVEDVAKNLVEPWRRAVVDSEALLREEVYPRSGASSEVDFWPGDDGGVPLQYRPSKVEFLLDKWQEFPALFDSMIWRSIDNPQSPEQAFEQAVREIVHGPDDLVPKGHIPVATQVKKWVPESAAVRRREDMPGAARASLAMSVDDLTDRSAAWLTDSKKQSGRFLKQSIIEYLNDQDVDAGVRADRKTTLVGQFRSMLLASEPLVTVNHRMLSVLHGGQQTAASQVIMTGLSVPDDESLRTSLRDAATSAGVDPGRVQFVLDPSQSCEVFRLHTTTLYHFAFDSVMETLANRWSQAENDSGLMEDFWRWRRTRPLDEWVPVDPQTRQALVKGWFIGRMLGHARLRNDERGRLRLQVLEYLVSPGGYSVTEGAEIPTEGGNWLSMPARGPRKTSLGQAPANVLELVAVGMIEAYRASSLEPLLPWGALINLAHQVDPISAWVARGAGRRLDGDALLPEVTGVDEQANQDRLAAVDDLVERLIQQTRRSVALARGGTPSAMQLEPLREIADDVYVALEAIRAEARAGVVVPMIG